MFDFLPLMKALGIVIIACPFLMVLVLGTASLLKLRLREHTINRFVGASMMTGLLAAVSILVFMLLLPGHDGTPIRRIPIDLGAWFEIPQFHYSIVFVFDRLSIPLVILSFILSGTTGVFSGRYLHREHGYNRFFTVFSLFVLGMVVTALAGTIQTLFAGWELVGLSSSLLVAYYHERPSPVANALWVWGTYRVSDAALLLAAVVLHGGQGHGDFYLLTAGGLWPDGHVDLPEGHALVVGLLLLLASAGKSGLIPFSGWLPRAMEGPTPSSAVFYGALSVHLGAFLLLRVSPLLDRSLWLSGLVAAVGLSTAGYAYLISMAQTDIKSALSFACLVQVGIIFAEIGFGLRNLALIHLLGHACLRTLQFVRAPNLLHDYHSLENALGKHLPQAHGPWHHLISERLRTALYRQALARGYLDVWLADFVIAPFLRVFRWCDSIERRWTDFLNGAAALESVKGSQRLGTIDELA